MTKVQVASSNGKMSECKNKITVAKYQKTTTKGQVLIARYQNTITKLQVPIAEYHMLILAAITLHTNRAIFGLRILFRRVDGEKPGKESTLHVNPRFLTNAVSPVRRSLFKYEPSNTESETSNDAFCVAEIFSYWQNNPNLRLATKATAKDYAWGETPRW